VAITRGDKKGKNYIPAEEKA